MISQATVETLIGVAEDVRRLNEGCSKIRVRMYRGVATQASASRMIYLVAWMPCFVGIYTNLNFAR